MRLKLKCVRMGTFWLVIAGCAFHPSPQKEGPANAGKEEVSASVPETRASDLALVMDWSTDPTGRLGKHLKAERVLRQLGPDRFQMTQPITLPATVPQDVYIGIELPKHLGARDVQFARGRIRIGERDFELVIQDPRAEVGKYHLVFSISGLNVVLSHERSDWGVLEFDFFSQAARLVSMQAEVRTPPSQLRVERIGVSEWRSQATTLQLGWLKPVTAGVRLNLLQVVRLTNEEAIPTEFHFDRRPGASFTQWVNVISHRDTGCGYVLDESPRQESFAEEILVLPLNESLVPEATLSMENRSLQDRLSVFVAPGEQQLIGYFAVGSGANRWMDSGPTGPVFHQITVPTECYRVCVARECHGPRGDIRKSAKGCFCTDWEDRRRSAPVTVGVNRGEMVLNLPGKNAAWDARFADLDIASDSEVRSIGVMEERTTVGWF